MRCYLAARCSPSVAHIRLPTAFCLLPSAFSESAGEDAREADEGNEGGHLLPEALPLIVRHEHLIARIEIEVIGRAPFGDGREIDGNRLQYALRRTARDEDFREISGRPRPARERDGFA